MQKFSKAFGRRKSSSNVLDDLKNAPSTESTFRVFERPGHGREKSFDGGLKLAKLTRAETSASQDDNIFEGLKTSRGSGASNSNTASTTDDSSRFSATSTTPSSTDLNHNDIRSANDRPFVDIPVPPVHKSSPNFLKAASRTFSFGRQKAATPPPTKTFSEFSTPNRTSTAPGELFPTPRAIRSSSYASTATPPKIEERELGLGDFSDMLSTFDRAEDRRVDLESNRAMSPSPDYPPPGPPHRGPMARTTQPSPLSFDRTVNPADDSFTWSRQKSSDRLMNASPVTEIGQVRDSSPPPVPQHATTNPRTSRLVASSDSGLRRSSALAARRQSTLEYGEIIDEDAKLLRESLAAARHMDDLPRATDSWINTSTTSSTAKPYDAEYRRGSFESTPRPARAQVHDDGENIFDSHIAMSADIAQQYQDLPVPVQKAALKNKVMTPAQFERYKQDQERLKSVGGKANDGIDDDEEDVYDDDEDEADKNRKIAQQRRKQEAHMAVYRQQMMKMTGETTAHPPMQRPGMVVSQSTPNLWNLGHGPEDEEDEDEEVPLAILAAHGFPNKNRAPTQLSSMASNPNLRSASQLGSYPAPSTGGADPASGGRLPVFARNLPQDPYLGAGLVNPISREPLSYGGGSSSVQGSPRGLPPGGLVGVIATEERSRAMRRGSPNAGGDFNPAPQHNGAYGMPMGQQMQVPPGMRGMPPMGPMTPGDEAQLALTQQMQQFMQMQMQFMQLMAVGGGTSSQSGQVPVGDMPRSSTMTNLPHPGIRSSVAPGHQRAISSLDPNAAQWMQQSLAGRQSMLVPPVQFTANGYTPSIAPSERSNVGQPGRYRPVSIYQADKSRSNTMSGPLQDWTPNKQNSTIKMVSKPNNEDEEDEEAGWEQMKQKRDKKKSMWKSKKDTSSMLGY